MKTTGIIHVFAECDDSESTTQNHQTGRRNAKEHAKRWSHRVKIDVGKIEMGTWSDGHALRIRTSRNENAWELGTGWH